MEIKLKYVYNLVHTYVKRFIQLKLCFVLKYPKKIKFNIVLITKEKEKEKKKRLNFKFKINTYRFEQVPNKHLDLKTCLTNRKWQS